jgi:predicted permease
MSFVDQLWRDARFAVRRLLATPMFTTIATVSLALGLGVTTAVYSTIDAVLWNTSPIEDAEHLAVITRPTPSSPTSSRWVASKLDFDDLRSGVHTVPALAASTGVASVLNDGRASSTFIAHAVTGNYFQLIRLPLAFGRGIEDADDRPGADPVVVLSHEFWQSKTGGDRDLVGRSVRIGGRPFVVIGILAESARNGRDSMGQFGLLNGDAWISLAAKSIVKGVVPPGEDADLTVIARLPKGTAVESVAAEVGGIGAALDRSRPLGAGVPGARPAIRSWSAVTASAIARDEAATSFKAGSAIVLLVGLVLVVACTNIANLTLGRGVSREHEFSVRRALGASRGRLVREQCAESVVLAAFGGAGALLVARILMHYLTTDIPVVNTVVAVHPRLNAAALIAAGGSLLVSLVVFGLVPAIQLTRASLRDRLAGDALGAPPSRWKGRRRLIACQVAISTAFMLIAFASARAVTSAARQDPGFDLPHLAVASVSFGPMHWDNARAKQAIASIDAAARTPSGFTSVALTMGLPLGESSRVRHLARVSTADHVFTSEVGEPMVRAMPSTPSIFQTLGVQMLRGRAFDDHDTAATPFVIVISEDVARKIFGGTDVVGRQMRYVGLYDEKPRSVEVIGVARDMNSRVFAQKFGTVYVPLAQQDAQRVLIVGRAPGDPAPMTRVFAGIVRQADPDLAVEFASTGALLMTPAFVLLRVAALLSGGLSILAVTLAMVGLYGVLSHVVGRRTREIGVRLALGAEASRVRRMIVGEGLRPVAWGLGIGLFVGVGARFVLRATAIAPNITAIDPLALAVATVTLVMAGLVASYLPAHRASKVDPNVALRSL